MIERMKTEAESHLHDGIEALAAAAVTSRRCCCHITEYRFSDGSSVEVRKLSGRSAFGPTGWHLADSK